MFQPYFLFFNSLNQNIHVMVGAKQTRVIKAKWGGARMKWSLSMITRVDSVIDLVIHFNTYRYRPMALWDENSHNAHLILVFVAT